MPIDNESQEEQVWRHRSFRIRSFTIILFAIALLALNYGEPWIFMILFGGGVWLFASANYPEFLYSPLKRLSDVSKVTTTRDVGTAYVAILGMCIAHIGMIGGVIAWLMS